MKSFMFGIMLAMVGVSQTAYAYSPLDTEIIQDAGGKKNKICIYKNGETRTIKHYQQCKRSIN